MSVNLRANLPLLILPWLALGLALWGLHFLIEGGQATGPTFVVAVGYWTALTIAWYFMVRGRLGGRG